MPSAHFVCRFDTLTRLAKDALLSDGGWTPKEGVPQFYISDANGPIDWPLLDTIEEAFLDCDYFNKDDLNDDLSETFGFRMMGAAA